MRYNLDLFDDLLVLKYTLTVLFCATVGIHSSLLFLCCHALLLSPQRPFELKLACKLKARLHMRFFAQFCRTFQCNFCRSRARDKNCRWLAAISVRFVAAISQRFRTCSKLDATWRRFEGNCSKYRTGMAAKSLLVYTCGKRCIEERDKTFTINHMCKRALILKAHCSLSTVLILRVC